MIVAFPHPPGAGGPGSFQIRFESELKKNSFTVVYAEDNIHPDLVFIVGGTKRLFWLWKMKLKGVPILYRLDGISWLHRKKKVGVKNFLLTESRNWLNKLIHAFFADLIVYQSQFVKDWWDREGLRKRINTSIIYNGIVLHKKDLSKVNKEKSKRLVILEGTIDYSPYAVRLLNDLAESLPNDIKIELYGKFEFAINEKHLNKRIDYNRFLDREKVFEVLSGSVYLSLDIHPACPNTVIEAMSVGAPIVAFDTGSLKELVDKDCGTVVPYGSDPWKLGYPDIKALKFGILRAFENFESLSTGARERVSSEFSIQQMIENYLFEIKNLVQNKK